MQKTLHLKIIQEDLRNHFPNKVRDREAAMSFSCNGTNYAIEREVFQEGCRVNYDEKKRELDTLVINYPDDFKYFIRMFYGPFKLEFRQIPCFYKYACHFQVRGISGIEAKMTHFIEEVIGELMLTLNQDFNSFVRGQKMEFVLDFYR